MTAIDQGEIMRQALKERIESAADDEVVFDCGFGWLPGPDGRLVVGYTVVFKARSPLPGKPALVSRHTLAGHTPTDEAVDDVVDMAVSDLREQAAQQLATPDAPRYSCVHQASNFMPCRICDA